MVAGVVGEKDMEGVEVVFVGMTVGSGCEEVAPAGSGAVGSICDSPRLLSITGLFVSWDGSGPTPIPFNFSPSIMAGKDHCCGSTCPFGMGSGGGGAGLWVEGKTLAKTGGVGLGKEGGAPFICGGAGSRGGRGGLA